MIAIKVTLSQKTARAPCTVLPVSGLPRTVIHKITQGDVIGANVLNSRSKLKLL